MVPYSNRFVGYENVFVDLHQGRKAASLVESYELKEEVKYKAKRQPEMIFKNEKRYYN